MHRSGGILHRGILLSPRPGPDRADVPIERWRDLLLDRPRPERDAELRAHQRGRQNRDARHLRARVSAHDQLRGAYLDSARQRGRRGLARRGTLAVRGRADRPAIPAGGRPSELLPAGHQRRGRRLPVSQRHRRFPAADRVRPGHSGGERGELAVRALSRGSVRPRLARQARPIHAGGRRQRRRPDGTCLRHDGDTLGARQLGVQRVTVVSKACPVWAATLTRWALANWVSDLPGFATPVELSYTSWHFRTRTFPSLNQQDPHDFPRPYPLVPMASAGSAVSLSGTLRSGSGVYARALQAPGAAAFTLLFNAGGTAALSALDVPRLSVIRIR